MTAFTIYNSDQAIVIHGEQLAHGSTRDSGRRRGGRLRDADGLRWTEMTIYRLDDGGYALERVGCSDVYHALNQGTSACGYGVVMPASELEEGDHPCTRCHPPAVAGLSDEELIAAEVDRSSVVFAPGAPELVAACWSIDDSGYQYMTDISRRVLVEAGLSGVAPQQTIEGASF
jgi:hypothetical protein